MTQDTGLTAAVISKNVISVDKAALSLFGLHFIITAPEARSF